MTAEAPAAGRSRPERSRINCIIAPCSVPMARYAIRYLIAPSFPSITIPKDQRKSMFPARWRNPR